MANRSRSQLERVEEKEKTLVVLLHGAFRTRLSLLYLERALKKAGFDVLNFSYSWRSHDIDTITNWVEEKLAPHANRSIFFVTHSFGGIVVRSYLHRFKPKNVHRVVMLAPPSQGSYVAHYSNEHPLLKELFHKIYGHSAKMLTPKALEKLPPPCCEFAVITGGTGKKKGYAPFLPGDNDGVVCVEESKLPGMKAFAVLPHRHTFIMNGRETIRLIVEFFQTGKFTT